ncbi:hypothetical protein ABT117_31210 [Streptomyces sp. NPDC002262]|uniref:hypothetical protein n=1 Tax=Streptomyces sp. NPDC002262 TaxID=3154414 RepID=UPI003331AB25
MNRRSTPRAALVALLSATTLVLAGATTTFAADGITDPTAPLAVGDTPPPPVGDSPPPPAGDTPPAPPSTGGTSGGGVKGVMLNNAAYGYLDSASPDITGWAVDPDLPNTPVEVRIVLTGIDNTAKIEKRVSAGLNRTDGNPAIGNHGFSFPASELAGLLPAGTYEVNAYVEDKYDWGGRAGDVRLTNNAFLRLP